MPRKPLPEDEMAEIKREVEAVLGQVMQLVTDMLRQVEELRQKLERLDQKKRQDSP